MQIPLFELYIKQERNWPYSSPMRTLMSIEEGHIPINTEKFDDHDINSCSIILNDNLNFYEIYDYLSKVNIEKSFKELDTLLKKFNESQKSHLENTIRAISEI